MELNLRQKKILELLSINCRFTNKDVGKAVGLSEDSVSYQIDKLIENEKLALFNVQFNYHMLGYDSYHIWIKLKKKENNFSKLSKIRNLININSSYGKFDLQLLVLAKSQRELKNLIKQIRAVISIRDLRVAKFKDFYKRFTNVIPPINVKSKIPASKKNFVYKLNTKLYAETPIDQKIKLDAIDKKIIFYLLKYPRANYQSLAEATGLNHETIRYRIKKFVDQKFINNFGLIHDFKKYNLYTTYFLVNLKGKYFEKDFKNYLAMKPNIFYCAKLDGDYNCILYVVSENPNELGKVYEEIIEILDNSVESIDLLFLDKIYKYLQFPEKELTF